MAVADPSLRSHAAVSPRRCSVEEKCCRKSWIASASSGVAPAMFAVGSSAVSNPFWYLHSATMRTIWSFNAMADLSSCIVSTARSYSTSTLAYSARVFSISAWAFSKAVCARACSWVTDASDSGNGMGCSSVSSGMSYSVTGACCTLSAPNSSNGTLLLCGTVESLLSLE